MSKERELLKKILNTGWLNHELSCEVEAILTLPEPIKEREVSGKIISTDDACNWNLTVGALKDYDHVYVNKIRYVEFQPEPLTPRQGLEEYKKGYAKAELDLKREPLTDEAVCKILLKKEWKGFVQLVRIIEKEHGIGERNE